MAFFDFLHEKGITMEDGDIKGELEERFEEIQLADRLRKALLWEDSEYYEEL